MATSQFWKNLHPGNLVLNNTAHQEVLQYATDLFGPWCYEITKYKYRTKIKVFKLFVLSVFLNGSKNWTVNSSDLKM